MRLKVTFKVTNELSLWGAKPKMLLVLYPAHIFVR